MRRYILREVSALFALALLILVTLLVLQKIIQITDWVVNRGVGLSHMFLIIALLLPFFLVMVIPMALLLATLLAVNRLSADSEVTALKAGGIGIGGLFYPVFMLGVLCTAFTGFLSLYLVPRATVWSETLLFNIARSSARAAVIVKSFQELAPGTVIYIDGIHGETLDGVMIAETGGDRKIKADDVATVFILAKEGRIVSDREKLSNYLLLSDGSIHLMDLSGKIYRKINFGRYDFRIDIEEQKSQGVERGSEFEVMDLHTLDAKKAEYLAKYNEVKDKSDEASKEKARAYRTAVAQIGISYHQKFSLPFACLILALWGIPLGIQPPRATRYQGIVVSIALSLAYYLMVSGGKILATRFIIDPVWAVWLPNAVVLGSGIVFLKRASRDKPLPFAETMDITAEFLQNTLSRLRRGKAS